MPTPKTIRPLRSRHTRAAFTLLELVLVLSIVATIGALAVPRFMRSLDHHRTEAAARQIIADLAYARSEAMHRSVARTVRYDAAADAYELLDVPHPDDPSRPYVIPLRAQHTATRIVSAEFDRAGVDDEVTDVVFDVYGRPDSGGSVVLTSGASMRTIVLDLNTGGATLQ